MIIDMLRRTWPWSKNKDKYDPVSFTISAPYRLSLAMNEIVTESNKYVAELKRILDQCQDKKNIFTKQELAQINDSAIITAQMLMEIRGSFQVSTNILGRQNDIIGQYVRDIEHYTKRMEENNKDK